MANFFQIQRCMSLTGEHQKCASSNKLPHSVHFFLTREKNYCSCNGLIVK